MKKHLLLLLVAIAALCSCSDKPNELSTSKVENLVEQLLKDSKQDQSYTGLKVGYYEENSVSARARLKMLQAAGIITYKVDRYCWWNKVLSLSYYYDWSFSGIKHQYVGNTYYTMDEHFMVTVALTKEGQKILVDSIPLPDPVVDKDMVQPELKPLLSKEELQEIWPNIPCPETISDEKEEPKEVVYDGWDAVQKEMYEEQTETKKTSKKKDNEYNGPEVMPLDIETSTAYTLAKEKEATADVILKSSKLKVKKARYIQIYESGENIMANAEIIIEMKDVTGAGRALDGKQEGIRQCANVKLLYFWDQGWVLLDKALNLSFVSRKGIEMAETAVVNIGDASELEDNY